MRLSGILKIEFEDVFVEPWSPFLAGVIIAIISVWLLISGYFWGVYGGIRNWGDWINVYLGLSKPLGIDALHLPAPWIHSTSLMNLSLVTGSFSASLVSRQFGWCFPPFQELVTGALGGVLMGIGATLAMGCNIGGFFNPINASSLSGWMMWLGLSIGAFIGLKLILWIGENIPWGTRPLQRFRVRGSELRYKAYLYPVLGLTVFLVTLGTALHWLESPDSSLVGRGILILCGFALGFVLHRSRFCFSKCFREPLVTGDGTQARAVMLSMLMGMLSFSLVFQKELIDPFLSVPPTFWLGSLSGGIIFGIGMLLAGGCATGSLWRAGEGQIKLVVVLFFFAWAGSTFSALIKQAGWLTRVMTPELIEETTLGVQAFLPQMLHGWTWTYVANFLFLAAWYLLVKYNEVSRRFSVL